MDNSETHFLQIPFAISYSDHEDNSGNFIQMLLVTISLFLLVIFGKKFNKNILIVTLTMVVGFILLSVLLKWNPWLSRFASTVFYVGLCHNYSDSE